MFRALHTIAQAATLHMIIVAEGEQLRVTLQPKPTGKDAPIPAALSLVATPEEFDTGFVEAITTWRAPQTSLVEQAAAAAAAALMTAVRAVSEAASPAKPDDKPKARTASKPAAKPAAKKKAAAEPPPKNAEAQGPEAETSGPAAPTDEAPRDKTSPEASAPTNPVADVTLPGTTTRAQATRKARVTLERALAAKDAADRLACIADMRAYLAGNARSDKPVKPSRADYLNKYKPTTGRRYERLFANFDELVAAAQQQALPEVGEPAPNAEAQQPGETNQGPGTDAVAAAPDTAVVASAPERHMTNPGTGWPLYPPTELESCGRTGGCLGTWCKPAQPAAGCMRYFEPKDIAPVALKDLQAPPADATDKLFEGAPILSGHKATEQIGTVASVTEGADGITVAVQRTEAAPAPFSLDII